MQFNQWNKRLPGIKLSSKRRLVEVALAVVLFAAAGLKAYRLFAHPGLFVPRLIHDEAILAGIIQVEMLLSLWLLIGGLTRTRFGVALISFTFFAAFASYETLRDVPTCGCFGNVKVPPVIMAISDSLALMVLWLTRPRRSQEWGGSPSQRRTISAVVFAIFATGALWTGYFLKLPTAEPNGRVSANSYGLVVLEPQSWLNKPFELLDEIEGSNSLRRGRWLVIFYHYDCDSCLQAIPLYTALSTSMKAIGSKTPSVAFIAMPPSAPIGQDPVLTSSNYSHLALRPDRDWLANTPIVAAIDNGKVLWADQGYKAVHPPIIRQWQ